MYSRYPMLDGIRKAAAGITPKDVASTDIAHLRQILNRSNWRFTRDPEASTHRVPGKLWNRSAMGRSAGTGMATKELRKAVSLLNQLYDSGGIVKHKDAFNRVQRDPRFLAGLEAELSARSSRG